MIWALAYVAMIVLTAAIIAAVFRHWDDGDDPVTMWGLSIICGIFWPLALAVAIIWFAARFVTNRIGPAVVAIIALTARREPEDQR